MGEAGDDKRGPSLVLVVVAVRVERVGRPEVLEEAFVAGVAQLCTSTGSGNIGQWSGGALGSVERG